MKSCLSLLALAVFAAHVSVPIQWASPDDFILTIADNPSQQRFDVILTSKASVPLCLSKEAWPVAEALPAGFDGAKLITSGGEKELLPTGSAYCPGGCGNVRVEPGESLAGVLPYAAFGEAKVIAVDPRRKLQFEVHPFVCSN